MLSLQQWLGQRRLPVRQHTAAPPGRAAPPGGGGRRNAGGPHRALHDQRHGQRARHDQRHGQRARYGQRHKPRLTLLLLLLLRQLGTGVQRPQSRADGPAAEPAGPPAPKSSVICGRRKDPLVGEDPRRRRPAVFMDPPLQAPLNGWRGRRSPRPAVRGNLGLRRGRPGRGPLAGRAGKPGCRSTGQPAKWARHAARVRSPQGTQAQPLCLAAGGPLREPRIESTPLKGDGCWAHQPVVPACLVEAAGGCQPHRRIRRLRSVRNAGRSLPRGVCVHVHGIWKRTSA